MAPLFGASASFTSGNSDASSLNPSYDGVPATTGDIGACAGDRPANLKPRGTVGAGDTLFATGVSMRMD